MKTEFKIKGKMAFEQRLFDIKGEQEVYNYLKNLGFYDLEVLEIRKPKIKEGVK